MVWTIELKGGKPIITDRIILPSGSLEFALTPETIIIKEKKWNLGLKKDGSVTRIEAIPGCQ